LDRLEECPAIPQPFDPIFPATTLDVLLFSFLAGISPVFGSETMKIKLVLFGIRFSSQSLSFLIILGKIRTG
jgi:hypothetical protein